ncbi:MAG: hypothetical protein KJ906_03965 [Nanoarchaeota archaeon]|nr:hypothetical protein [Nanoarchaeota archaeon]
MSELEQYAEDMEFKKVIITLVVSSFGFLLALYWRDVLRETIEIFLPPGEGLIYKYIIAIGITIFISVLVMVLLKIQKMDIIPDNYEPQKRIVYEIRKRKIKKK